VVTVTPTLRVAAHGLDDGERRLDYVGATERAAKLIGHPASSIRERIYALPEVGYGVLLYTGSSDAEGTLGGLVEVGRRIADSIKAAIDLGKLCSNDPFCSQHVPESPHERRFLQGAACHGCLLIAETSCEQQNDLLDRALVVRTVHGAGAEFFSEQSSLEATI